MTRRRRFKGWVILRVINWLHLEHGGVIQSTGRSLRPSHTPSLIIFCLNQPPEPTCNLAASHRRSAGCKLLRWFYCPAAIKGVEPMTRSYRAHTSIHSIFISHFKKHWSHQNCLLTTFSSKAEVESRTGVAPFCLTPAALVVSLLDNLRFKILFQTLISYTVSG